MSWVEIRRLLELAEERLNAHSDDGLSWWPFSFLKPDVHLPITALRALALAVLYAVPACLVAVVMGQSTGDHLSPRWLARVTLASTATFFVVFRCSFALVWNRRARRLQSARARRSTFAAAE